MLRIGITGQAGFVGTHLYNALGLIPDKYERIIFKDCYFGDESALRRFVGQCDVIIHLAAMNRHPDPQVIYNTNIGLTKHLIDAMDAENVFPHVIFSSSTQEDLDNEYGKSKRDSREMLEEWATRCGTSFSGLVVPNVFGPFCLPNYNSFVATFCYNLVNDKTPQILHDASVKFIYVHNLCLHIIAKIEEVNNENIPVVEKWNIPCDFEKKVTEILSLLENYKEQYFVRGYIPFLNDLNEVNLFNTFRSYIDIRKHFPVKLVCHEDERGIFVETIKLGVGGQVSFSTTAPGITRGNHYHTRKIERFTVIKGKARIEMRRIGTEEVTSFELDGRKPAYVDMPVWFTHNIENIGDEELYTQFWINEWYDPNDGDTYFEAV